MSTIVVHVNSTEFRDNPAAVYIGRRVSRARDPRCHKASAWENPYTVDEFGIAGAIAKYEDLLRLMLKSQSSREELLLLDGATLGCWCKNHGHEPCHGDVLIKLINELKAGGAS